MYVAQAQDAIEDIDATSDVHSPADKQAHGQEDTQACSQETATVDAEFWEIA